MRPRDNGSLAGDRVHSEVLGKVNRGMLRHHFWSWQKCFDPTVCFILNPTIGHFSIKKKIRFPKKKSPHRTLPHCAFYPAPLSEQTPDNLGIFFLFPDFFLFSDTGFKTVDKVQGLLHWCFWTAKMKQQLNSRELSLFRNHLVLSWWKERLVNSRVDSLMEWGSAREAAVLN